MKNRKKTGFVLLSGIFSINKKASWLGNYVSFEGVFVLIGYGILFVCAACAWHGGERYCQGK